MKLRWHMKALLSVFQKRNLDPSSCTNSNWLCRKQKRGYRSAQEWVRKSKTEKEINFLFLLKFLFFDQILKLRWHMKSLSSVCQKRYRDSSCCTNRLRCLRSRATGELLLEWQSVTLTLLPIPKSVTVTADHCIYCSLIWYCDYTLSASDIVTSQSKPIRENWIVLITVRSAFVISWLFRGVDIYKMVKFSSQNSSWMTSEFFGMWLKELNKKMIMEKRKILLTVDAVLTQALHSNNRR